MRRISKMEVVSQSVMFPESITLDESQRAALEEIDEDLRKLGFSLEYDSDNNWLITAVPAMLKKGNPKDLILRILDSVTEDSVNYGVDGRGEVTITSRAALLMARSSAITRGEKLTASEMEHICAELFM